jgi:hypothetical protein
MFKTFSNGLIACYKSVVAAPHRICGMECSREVTKIIIDPSVFIICLKEVMSHHTIRSIYFPNVHSHLMCGLAFWSGSARINGSYKLQERVMCIISDEEKSLVDRCSGIQIYCQ